MRRIIHSIKKFLGLNEITSAIYANVIAKLKGTEIVRELVEMKISDYGIYCVT